MKITNKSNIEEPLFEAITNDDYSGKTSWRTVTQLIRAPQEVFLMKKHDKELEEDAQDLFYRFLGSMAHLVVERAAKRLIEKDSKSPWASEERIHVNFAGKEVSGQFDLYNAKTQTLYDIKTCSGYEVAKNKPIKQDWLGQAKCLVALLSIIKKPVKRIVFQRIVRDWSVSTANRMEDFPDKPFIDVELPTPTPEEAMKFLTERIHLHLSYEKGEQIDCTAEERYATPEIWAVMKTGRKSAIKLYSDKDMAYNALKTLGGTHVEHRPSENKRCQLYCSVREFCPQFRRTK